MFHMDSYVDAFGRVDNWIAMNKRLVQSNVIYAIRLGYIVYRTKRL